MMYGIHNYLFSENDLDSSLRKKNESIQELVDQIPKDQFLCTPQEDVVRYLVEHNTIDPIVIFDDRIVATEPKECKVDVSGDPTRFIRNPNQPCYIPGLEISIEIPFSGDSNLLKLKTNPFSTIFPTGEIRTGRNKVGGTIVLEFRQPHDANPKQMKSAFDENLQAIKKYVGWSKSQVDSFNQNLPIIVEKAVKFRREKLDKHSSVVDVLGIRIKPKDGAPCFEPIILDKKIIKPLPAAPREGYKVEPGISENIYNNILKLIRHSGSSFEKTPQTFFVHDEGELRDIVLSQLNVVYEGDAKGEAFNKSGKTDILVSEEGRSAFIAECKIWRGKKYLIEAIDQLLSYLTWRDCKTCLIIFNKNNKNFCQILESIEQTVSEHPRFYSKIRQNDENEWLYEMRSQDDDARFIKMNIMIFNIYCKT